MRVTSKGQVTIPIALREKAKIFPETEVEFGFKDGEITIRKAAAKKDRMTRGERIVARAAGTANANLDLTTDQIMAWTRGWDDEDDPDR